MTKQQLQGSLLFFTLLGFIGAGVLNWAGGFLRPTVAIDLSEDEFEIEHDLLELEVILEEAYEAELVRFIEGNGETGRQIAKRYLEEWEDDKLEKYLRGEYLPPNIDLTLNSQITESLNSLRQGFNELYSQGQISIKERWKFEDRLYACEKDLRKILLMQIEYLFQVNGHGYSVGSYSLNNLYDSCKDAKVDLGELKTSFSKFDSGSIQKTRYSFANMITLPPFESENFCHYVFLSYNSGDLNRIKYGVSLLRNYGKYTECTDPQLDTSIQEIEIRLRSRMVQILRTYLAK